MKTKNFLRRAVLLIMALTTLSIHASVNRGTITIEVDEYYYVNLNLSSYSPQSATWGTTSTAFRITEQGSKGCTICGTKVGTGTLTCKGFVNGDIMDYYWTVNVVAKPTPVGVNIDAINFPDANFRNWLLRQSYGEDGVLTEAEIKETTVINVNSENISSLKGIEIFTKLAWLYCYDNQLTTLDVSDNAELRCLWCYDNPLTTLDVSKNIKLTELRCSNISLTTLNVSNNAALSRLYCSNNQLTTLDVSNNIALTELYCYKNQLTALDVSNNTALRELDCDNNQLTTLNVSKNIALTDLHCENNQLTTLDVARNTALIILWCSNNQLTSLDVSKNTAIRGLHCYNNQLTAIDVSKNTALTNFYCPSNQLMTLDVSKNTGLEYFGCNDNQLTTLDVSKNTTLKTLECYNNQLTTLDVSKNTALKELDCDNNQLTTLYVSKNTALTDLHCENNQLTTLDVSKSAALTRLHCYRNQIQGAGLDALISSLSQNNTTEEHQLRIYYPGSTEGNVCTINQAEAIKAKGWIPMYYNSGWTEYEGYDDRPVSITLPEIETVAVNKTITLTPTIEPADAVTELTWESDDETIAKVTSSGMVMGIKTGAAIITVRTSNGLKAECFVIVEDPTGIKDVKADSRANVPVYTVSGQKVTGSLKGKKGVYIVGGKKVVVK